MKQLINKKDAEVKALKSQLQKIRDQARAFRESNRCFFFKPYGWQQRAIDLISKKNISVVAAPNKIGKTCLNANIAYSWIIGYEPWTMKDKEFEGSIKQGSMFYRPSSLGIKPPVKIRITGEDWKSHLGETVIPAFKHWFPKGTYKTKRNEQGVEYLWTFENGSTIELMTYKQKEELSESWMGHGWIPDEPPPKWLWGGMSRGVFLSGGKVFIPTTPLKEAWILDDLILSDRRDIGVIDDLLITDNEDLYKDEKDKLIALGLQEHQISMYFDLLLWKHKEKQVYVDDRGKTARNFVQNLVKQEQWDEIDKLKILRFVQDTEPDDAPSRFGGAFKSLVGRVLKSFRKEIHWIEPFKVPTDWPVVAMIDFHLNKPHAVSFHAVNKQDVCFVIHEIWENMSTEELADSIIRYKTNNALRLEEVYIDPLSKGDTGYMRNRLGTEVRDSYSIIEERLAEHNIVLDVASKDKTSGIMNIEARLKGVNGMPTYYVFNTCARHFYEVMRWVYDEGEPKKEYDDMMENWYRATLTGLHFEDMRPKDIKYPDYIGTHAWMGN